MNTVLDDIVPGNGKQSLREAINRANATPGADVIVVPAGVFKIALSGADENTNATGDFDITDTVTIQGAGKGITVIDGQQLDRVFDVAGTAPGSINAVFQGLTVRNGDVTGSGGGIKVSNANLVVRDAIVSGSRASSNGGGIAFGTTPETGNIAVIRTTVGSNVAKTLGGGIWVSDLTVLTVKDSTVRRNIADFGGGYFAATSTLTNSAVTGNVAFQSGGGIRIFGVATISSSTVNGNSALGGSGGGIDGGRANLTNSTVSGNSSGSDGGGINLNRATLTNASVIGNSAGGTGGGIYASTLTTLTNCTVSGNCASSGGGGIYAVTTVAVTNSTVSGNSAEGNGGGIWATTATLTNSTFSSNSAGNVGGGVAVLNGASLVNCTIVENIAHSGGGIFHGLLGVFEIRNTIVALNLVDFAGGGPDASGDFISAGHNLIGIDAGSLGFSNGFNGEMVGTAANPIDPKIGVLRNNGGRTQTHALLAGSPAIDRGDNSLLPPTDQRGAGFARKKDGDGNGSKIADIGAFER